jgi:hypothetical protein
MEDAERRRACRQLWDDDRQLLGRIVFWSALVGVWGVLRLLWHLRVLRSRYWS